MGVSGNVGMIFEMSLPMALLRRLSTTSAAATATAAATVATAISVASATSASATVDSPTAKVDIAAALAFRNQFLSDELTLFELKTKSTSLLLELAKRWNLPKYVGVDPQCLKTIGNKEKHLFRHSLMTDVLGATGIAYGVTNHDLIIGLLMKDNLKRLLKRAKHLKLGDYVEMTFDELPGPSEPKFALTRVNLIMSVAQERGAFTRTCLGIAMQEHIERIKVN